MRPVIFLDMDCVLTSFVEAALAAHGLTLGDVEPHWPAGAYGMTEPIGKVLRGREQVGECGMCDGRGKRNHGNGRSFLKDCDGCRGSGAAFTDADFWRPIHASPRFWHDMPPTPWAVSLLGLAAGYAAEFGIDWYVVTAPSRCPGCVPGKQEWLNRVLGVEWSDKLIPTPHKHLLAGPGRVLIDDADSNCEAFLRYKTTGKVTGGHAITFPALHNHMHAQAADPMSFVRAALESWVRGETRGR